jgi:hypothetical protein
MREKKTGRDQVRNFLRFRFMGVQPEELLSGDAFHVFRLRAAKPPHAELVVSTKLLSDVGPVPYLDDETARALTRKARVVLTSKDRKITEQS